MRRALLRAVTLSTVLGVAVGTIGTTAMADTLMGGRFRQ
jgi:hypothetical protein